MVSATTPESKSHDGIGRHFPTNVREAAALYLAKGILPIPLKPKTKIPALSDWPNLRLTIADLDRFFPADVNLGVILGKPSGGLLDADLDCIWAIRAASRLLIPTGWISGHRPTAPCSHGFYLSDNPPDKASESFHDPVDGKKLCELRSTNGQTMLPPSLWVDKDNPSKFEPVVWERFDEPVRVDAGDLRAALARVAAAAVLGRYWPKGSRHNLAGALAGGLLRGGWQVEQVVTFLTAVAEAAGDKEVKNRQDIVTDTVNKLTAGKPVTGWPKAIECLGDRGKVIIDTVITWLGVKPGGRVEPGGRGEPVTWATPKVAYRPLPPYKEFPVRCLPPVLRDYVIAAAAGIGCDVSMVAGPALAVAAAAIGNSRALVLKRGWIEHSVIWSLIVAESGDLKSPACDAAVEPLTDLQIERAEEHKMEVKAYQQDLKDCGKDGEKPEPPEPLRVHVTKDVTIEKVGMLLRDNPHGLLVSRDEMDAWFQALVRYRAAGTDRPQWLERHTAGTLIVHRVTREESGLFVPRAAVSITGGIQPGVLRQALNEDAMQAGLGARFMLGMPPKRQHVWTEADLPEELVDAYRNLLDKLLKLPLEDEAKRKPYYLGMTREGKQLWIQWYNEWGQVQYDAEGAQASCFSKIEAYAARLALLHHVICETVNGGWGEPPWDGCSMPAVGAESMQAAIELARWYSYEAQRVYTMLREVPEEREARKLVEWIAARGGRVTSRQLQKSNSRKWPSGDLAESALQGLVDGGLGQWTDVSPPGRGRPTRMFVLSVGVGGIVSEGIVSEVPLEEPPVSDVLDEDLSDGHGDAYEPPTA
jgi:hypothetical protein